MTKTPVTVAKGDGIGPEIMNATLKILDAAGAQLDLREISIGEEMYKSGQMTGIEPGSWDVLRETGVFLKAPITTPRGGGFKSLNVTVRKSMGLYANVRPCVSYHPYVNTLHPKMDLVVVRENEEDLYAGVEHRQTQDVIQCLKLITREGSERIIRFAFEYARAYGRKKVTCMVKDNIMKLADGMFIRIFRELAEEYPDIETDDYIIDIGAARIASRPSDFDVIVTENLYGDIISDIAAEVTGSVGLGGSSNIGDKFAMFEAVHGSAPDIAGQGIANPSGLLLGAVMMLVHIGQGEVAETVHNAWLKTLEEGVHTGDIYRDSVSKKKVGTDEFAAAVIERLGQKPEQFAPVSYAGGKKGMDLKPPRPRVEQKKELVGVDIFLNWEGGTAKDLGDPLSKTAIDGLELRLMSARGVKVWPDGMPETKICDHWRCRFTALEGKTITHQHVIDQLSALKDAGYDFIKTELLFNFDGQAGYSKAQGE